MDSRRFHVFLLVFYPFALALSVAGFLAFLLIIGGINPAVVSLATIWFCFACSAFLCAMFGRALRGLGFHSFFLGYTGMLGALSLSLTIILVLFSP
ncbi:MAG: hypothetical protein QW567_03090 [Candidatus Hadarchaeales archaeon]